MFKRNVALSKINGNMDGDAGSAAISDRGMVTDSILPFGADYVLYAYSGGFVTTATYKVGGSSGTTIAVATYANNGTDITSTTLTFPAA